MDAQNINEILDALGARFGATGAHLWDVLVRQVVLEGYAMAGAAVGLVFVAWLIAVISLEEGALIFAVLATIAAAAFGIPGVLMTVNPEAYVVQDFLRVLQ